PAYRRNVESSTATILKKMQQQRASRPDFKAHLAAGHREKTGEEPDPELLNKLCEALARGDFDVDVHPVYSLTKIPLAGEFAKIIPRMQWVVVQPTARSAFVTGDNPLSYVAPRRDPAAAGMVGLLHRDIELTFPIARDRALIARSNDKFEDGAVADL